MMSANGPNPSGVDGEVEGVLGIAMPTATLTSKGQITVPLAVRIPLGLTVAQKIDFLPEGDSFRVVALRKDVSVLRGRFAGRLKKSVSIAQMDATIARASIKGV
jgi:antitoxin PrlF